MLLPRLQAGSSFHEQRICEPPKSVILAVVHKFTLLRVDEPVEIHAIYRFEPSHSLSPGLSKILREVSTGFCQTLIIVPPLISTLKEVQNGFLLLRKVFGTF